MSGQRQDPEYHEVEGVRIGADGIAEMDGARRLVFVPKNDIARLELVYGSGAERPWLTLALGILLIGLGAVALARILSVFIWGSRVRLALFWMLSFGYLGCWLIWLTIRRRFLLLVRMQRGSRKVVFPSSMTSAQARTFVTYAAQRFGYVVK